MCLCEWLGFCGAEPGYMVMVRVSTLFTARGQQCRACVADICLGFAERRRVCPPHADAKGKRARVVATPWSPIEAPTGACACSGGYLHACLLYRSVPWPPVSCGSVRVPTRVLSYDPILFLYIYIHMYISTYIYIYIYIYTYI